MAHNPLALAQLMALHLSPPQMVQLVADTGCTGAGIRLWPTAPNTVFYPLVTDLAMRRETLAALRDTGVRILDVEVARLNERFDLARDFAPVLEVCAELGAAHINVVCDDTVESRLVASYAALCEAARPLGLSCDIEFMPWTAVKTLADAKRVVGAAAQANGGLIVDALHFARSGSRLEDLDDVPRAWLHWAQICDGPVPGPTTEAELIYAARNERLLPGEGDIDLPALFARLPADLTVSIEVPSVSRAPKLGDRAWAAQAKAATERVLARAAR